MPRLICLLLLLGPLVADEWVPHAHPATLERELTGFTRPRRTMLLAAEYGGRIATIRVDDGEVIADGSSVIELDATLATLAVSAAEARLTSLTVACDQAQAQQALSAREQTYQESELARIEQLTAAGQASAEERDRLRYLADRARLASETARLAVAQAEAARQQGTVALAEAREALHRHQVTAPSGWTVIERLHQPGSVVAPQQAILSLADTRTLVIPVSVSARELQALRQAPEIHLRFPHFAHHEASGHLARVAVDFDPVTRKRLAEIDLPGEAAPEASGGIEVRITVPVPDPTGGLMVPRRFVRFISEQPFVQTTAGERRAITILRSQEDHVVIARNEIPIDARLSSFPPDDR